MSHPAAPRQFQLERIPSVLARLGVSRATLYRYIEAGKFPKPVRLIAGGAVAWRQSDVDAFIAARVAEAVE